MSDEKDKQELKKKFYKVDFSQLSKMIVSDVANNKQSNIMFRTFSKERVVEALQNPSKNEDVLRNVSNFLYVLSPHYKRLCNYYAEMLTLDHYIEPFKLDVSKVNIEQFKRAYNESLDKLENMNIKHEMSKCLQVLYREGVFYGCEYETDDSYFIQKLDPDYCRISSVEDGVYNFKFDFRYFEMDESKLDNYAPEFKTLYNRYKKSKQSKGRGKKQEDLQWQELNSEKTICIKTDETTLGVYPPFVGVLPDIYDIQDYKSLKKSNSEMQNYALISGNIPMGDKGDTYNDFKIDMDTALQFGNRMMEELPDQVGFMLSIFDDMQIFRFNDDKSSTDKVEEATDAFWSSTGTSKNLFSDGGSTDASVRASMITDEQSAFTILRQIERWINRKMKFTGKKYKFKVNMLNVTRFNQKEKVAEELKAAQFGLSNKIKLYTMMGNSQSSVESMNFLENDVLDIPSKWIPLASSHTQKGGDVNSPTGGEKGNPSKEEQETRTDNGGDE